MATENAEKPTETAVSAEKTPEQVADGRLDELLKAINTDPDDVPAEEAEETEAEIGGEGVVEEEVEAKVEKKAADSSWKPSGLIRFAKQLGVSDAKIASLSIDALDLLCDGLAEQREAEVAANAAKEQAAAEPEPDEDEVLLKELAEELDPKVFKLLEKSVKKTKTLEAEIAATKKTAEQQRITKIVQEVDSAFAELDSPLLGGKAEGRTMQQDAEEMERRNLIVRMAYEKPIQGKSIGEAIKIYAKKILGIAASEHTPAASVATEKKQRWQEAATSKPTKRREVEEPGDEAAVKAVGRWMKEVGWNDE